MLRFLIISMLLIGSCFAIPYNSNLFPLVPNNYNTYTFQYIDIVYDKSDTNAVHFPKILLYNPLQENTRSFGKLMGFSKILNFSNNKTTSESDSIAFFAYFSQCLLLSCSLISLYFYDPRNTSDEFNYLFTSTLFTFGYLSLNYSSKILFTYLRSITNIQTPQLYIFGVLGSLTGMAIPLLIHSNIPPQSQSYTNKIVTGVLSGFVIGTTTAFTIQNKCNLTYNESVLICSYSLTGIAIGAVLSQMHKNTSYQQTLLYTVIGGWSGLITGYLLESLFPSSRIDRNSIDFSLPAITTIPVIIASKHFPKLKDFSFTLAEFYIQF